MPKRPPQGRGSGGRVTPSPSWKAGASTTRGPGGGSRRGAATTGEATTGEDGGSGSPKRSRRGARAAPAGPSSATGTQAAPERAGDGDLSSPQRRKGRVLEAAPRGRRRSGGGATKAPSSGGGRATTGSGPVGKGTDEGERATGLLAGLRTVLSPPGEDYVPPKDRPRPWWGIGDVAIWFAVSFVASNLVLYVVAVKGGYALDWPTGPGARLGEALGRQASGQPLSVTLTYLDEPLWVRQGLQLMPLWLTFLIGPLYVVWRKGTSLREDFKLAIKWVDVPIGLLVGVICQIGVNSFIYGVLFRFIPPQDVSEQARGIVEKATTPFLVAFVLVTVGLLAPVFEELFFRGLALQAFNRRLGLFWGGAVTALFFGLVHGNLLTLPALAAFGAVLAFLVDRFDRLGPAITAHVTYNLVTAVALIWNLPLLGS